MRGNNAKSRIFSWNRLFVFQNKGLSCIAGTPSRDGTANVT
jgi:hypothetical protein